eukprot:7294216-Ditylum_brightwellii.AAC.1
MIQTHNNKKVRSTYTATKAREVARVPRGAVPIMDVKEGNTIMFTPPSPQKRMTQKTRESNKTFQEFLHNQPRWIRQMVENATHKEGQERLKETIMSEEGIWIGSNGGTAINIMWENNRYVTGNRNLMETLRME